MASFNKVIVIGNLTRDPEIRYTSAGKAVANVSLAINRKNGDKDETTFVEITVWEKQAESCSQYLAKGDPALFEGRLQSESWTDKDTGAKRSKLIIVADRVVFIKQRQDQADGGDGSGYEDQQPPQRQQYQQVPQRQQQPQRQAPVIPDNGGFGGEEDDIPF
jgi:single-strand DNA-binding protein